MYVAGNFTVLINTLSAGPLSQGRQVDLCPILANQHLQQVTVFKSQVSC